MGVVRRYIDFLTLLIPYSLVLALFCSYIPTSLVINPWRACAARVTVVVLYVCMSVCLSAHAILAVRVIKSIMKDTIILSIRFGAILTWHFS